MPSIPRLTRVRSRGEHWNGEIGSISRLGRRLSQAKRGENVVPRQIISIQMLSGDCVRLWGGPHAKIKKCEGRSHKLALLLDTGGKSKG